MSPDSIEIAYMDDASDLRGDAGTIYQVHTLCVDRDDPEMEEAVDELETAVSAFLQAGVLRWATSMPVTPEAALERATARFQMPDDDEEDEDR